MNTKNLLLGLLLAACALGAQAQPTVDAFAKCLSESTTGKDRKDLARWLFLSMSAHPDMKAVATVLPSAPEESHRIAGALFTRLIAEQCPKQAKAAVDAVGPVAIQSAFTVLGQLAMQELMADKDVAAGMSMLQRHIDSAKLQAAISGK
jgi:hypothetical protein